MMFDKYYDKELLISLSINNLNFYGQAIKNN